MWYRTAQIEQEVVQPQPEAPVVEKPRQRLGLDDYRNMPEAQFLSINPNTIMQDVRGDMTRLYTFLDPVQQKHVAYTIARYNLSQGRYISDILMKHLTPSELESLVSEYPHCLINIIESRYADEALKHKLANEYVSKAYTSDNIGLLNQNIWYYVSPEIKQHFIKENIENVGKFKMNILEGLPIDYLLQSERESGYKIPVSNAILGKFPDEDFKKYIDANIEQIGSFESNQLILKLTSGQFHAYFDSDTTHRYIYASDSLKYYFGVDIIDYLPGMSEADMKLTLEHIPDHLFSNLSQDRTNIIRECLVKVPKILDYSPYLWQFVKEEDRKKIYDQDLVARKMPSYIKKEYLEHFEKKYDLISIPRFLDRKSLQETSHYYFRQSEDDLKLDPYLIQAYGEETAKNVDMFFSAWDGGFKNDNQLIVKLATTIVGKSSPLDDELPVMDSGPFTDVVATEFAPIPTQALIDGFKEIYDNTQTMFKLLNIKQIPVCRYRTVSFDMIDKRFTPEYADVIKEKLKEKKPFLLNIKNHPTQTRMLASYSYSPSACFNEFGSIKSSNTISVKEFMLVPVEKVQSVSGGLMAKAFGEEFEAILLDAHGIPCDMVVTYGFDRTDPTYAEQNSTLNENFGVYLQNSKESKIRIDVVEAKRAIDKYVEQQEQELD